MKLILDKIEASHPRGVEVAIRGFKGDWSLVPAQVFVEVYEGKLRVHIWDGTQQDPIATHVIEPL